MNVILDLDGVIWLAEKPIPGSPEAVERLRGAGHRVLFLTNNSNPTVADLVEKLGGMGIPAEPDEIAASSHAAALLVEDGETALVCGGEGVAEALRARGAETVYEGDADAVVVGFHREFDYKRLTVAFRAVIGGARLIGTNDDPTYPTPDGPVPGGGSLLAAVATAASAKATVAGKPHQAMADLVRSRLGDDLDGTVLVGDRPSTDGRMAERLGVPFVFVKTGVKEEPDRGIRIDAEAADLASVVDDEGNVKGL
jgi:HAD superfamily hydrolase (TIGR01450 family)